MAHVAEQQQVRTRDQLGSALAAVRQDQRVVPPVDHQRRHSQPPEGLGSGRRASNGRHLAGEPLGVEHAVECRGQEPGHRIGVVVAPARPDLRRRHAVGDEPIPVHRRRGGQRFERLRRRIEVPALTGRRHDRGHRQHPIGVINRHLLHDHPAHRHPGDVRGLDAQMVQQPHAVVAEVGQRVGHGRQRLARQRGLGDRHHVHLDPVQVRRQADIAVVEADDESSPLGELLPEAGPPPQDLRRVPVHQQQRRIGRIAVGLVVELDRCRFMGVGGRKGHEGLLVAAGLAAMSLPRICPALSFRANHAALYRASHAAHARRIAGRRP